MANEDMGYASSVSFKRWRAAGAARVDDNRRIAVRFKRVMAAGSARVDSRRIAAHTLRRTTHRATSRREFYNARVLRADPFATHFYTFRPPAPSIPTPSAAPRELQPELELLTFKICM